MEQPVDLGKICAATHDGCMGLPQELVDQIMDVLYDDIPVLKACSLTCKAMFTSTRRLIHSTLQLSLEKTRSILTREEERRYRRVRNRDVELRYVSFMGERGLLKYARRVHICTPYPFTPEILSPHLHHFRSLNHVHTLIIDNLCADEWVNYHTAYFAHFYPTLTSLTLSHSCGHSRLLHFALRFPNLENLSLEWLQESEPSIANAVTLDLSPPLRGCLRLVGYGTLAPSLTDLFLEPPKGFNFRSAELDNFSGIQAQRALNACARTLENLTITVYTLGNFWLPFLPSAIAERFSYLSVVHAELQYLNLTEMAVLHRLTFRTTFDQVFFLDRPLVLGVLSTITSPAFHEFVLELGRSISHSEGWSMTSWGLWRDFDDFFEERFAKHGDFRLIIRTSEPSDREDLRRQASEWGFPLLAGRGCIYFEESYQT